MANCMTPYQVKDKTNPHGHTISIPCGKCPNCRMRRIQGWAFRLKQEDRLALSSFFVTLTYDAENVPIIENSLTLCKRDVQLYIKRLRKAQSEYCSQKEMQNPKIVYFACGEYGGKTKRPHYHLIIFNVLNDEHIHQQWGKGFTYSEIPQTDGAFKYSIKYMNKPSLIPQYHGDKRQKEFQLMSKGIGQSYLSERNIQWHQRNIMDRVCLHQDGYKIAMPRYYKDKIYKLTEETQGDEQMQNTTNPIRKAVGKISQQKSEQRAEENLRKELNTKSMDQIIHNKVEADKQKIKQFNKNKSND